MAYADSSYYTGTYGGTDTEGIDVLLDQASADVDILTYNRIQQTGFSSLTEFQQGNIKKVVCMQADFRRENADMISSVLQSYSLNGVSMDFGNSWNVSVQDGVAFSKQAYAVLQMTGLCFPGIGGGRL